MKYPPYHISHLPLHETLQMPSLDTSQDGHYLVLWWKDIPLGHVYIMPKRPLSTAAYYKKLADAIRPTLRYYVGGRELLSTPWEQWIAQHNQQAWNKWMQTILAPVLPEHLPATVPVSVIICTRNRASYLQRCLEMLKTLECLPQEVIVVDNAPSDNSSEEVTKQYPKVRYCREVRPGLDIARNTGIKAASAEIVAFLDDDVVAHPLWVYRIWEAFQNPETTAVTGLVFASQLQTEAQQIFERHWSFNRGYENKVYDHSYFEDHLELGPPVWEIGAGANMAFRRSVFEKTGYFDELLDAGAAGCNGDSEMWFRILAAGYKIRYAPLAIVHHEHRREMEALKKQIFNYMRGFAAAALFQQQRVNRADYKKRLIFKHPFYFARLIKKGFPFYKFRYRTVWLEMGGVLSGVLYYLRNRHNSSVK
ncbi:family 2 glycosyl transferase [Flammeovirgaceae bacterium 311]|nr:family 2 glycosyl transferase [Flammeovirgaceae bacterium 311]